MISLHSPVALPRVDSLIHSTVKHTHFLCMP